MILVDQMPTAYGALGSTFGKQQQEQNVTRKLKDREAFLQKHSVFTGIDQFDAVVRGFDVKLAKKAGSLTRVRAANFAHRRSKCQNLQKSCAGEKESCKYAIRSARERQVKVAAEISKQQGFRPSTAPLPSPHLKVVGKTFCGSLLENRPDVKSPLENTRASTAQSCPDQNGMHRVGCSSARKYYKSLQPSNGQSSRSLSAKQQVGSSRKSTVVRSTLSIVGISKDLTAEKESEHPSNIAQTNQMKQQEPYLVTSKGCPVIRGMRPARYCMPARVFYGSLRAGMWSPDGYTGFGRIQVFPDPCP